MQLINQINTNTIEIKYIQIQKKNQHDYQNLNIDQEDYHYQNVQQEIDEIIQPSYYKKVFFSYLYFTQGLVIAFSITMPYIYPELPSYSVMSIFNAALLPYSFKFILAPFLEKYSLLTYGKRKFWIIVSQILSSFCVFISSFYIAIDEAKVLAVFLFAANFFFTLQDISLDSLAKKQLKIPHLISTIASTTQLIGTIFGSMILLKLSSLQFAQSINLSSPILSVDKIIKGLGILIFTPIIFIHFFFTETLLRNELEAQNCSIIQIIGSYKIFFRIKGKYFRTCVYLVIATQGFNFFNAGYDYELITAGFSRNTLNTIQNIVSIPVSIITCMLTKKIQQFGIKKGILISMTGQLMIYLLLRVFFPLKSQIIMIVSFCLSLLDNWRFLIGSIFIYEFPIHKYSGMFITFLASCANLGSTLTIHTKILDKVSWWMMSYIGLGMQLILILAVQFWMVDWKDKGTVVFQQLEEKKDKREKN